MNSSSRKNLSISKGLFHLRSCVSPPGSQERVRGWCGCLQRWESEPFCHSETRQKVHFILVPNSWQAKQAKQLNSRQAHWALFLICFNFHLSYRPSSTNKKLDALRRIKFWCSLTWSLFRGTYVPTPTYLRCWNHQLGDWRTGQAKLSRMRLSQPAVPEPGFLLRLIFGPLSFIGYIHPHSPLTLESPKLSPLSWKDFGGTRSTRMLPNTSAPARSAPEAKDLSEQPTDCYNLCLYLVVHGPTSLWILLQDCLSPMEPPLSWWWLTVFRRGFISFPYPSFPLPRTSCSNVFLGLMVYLRTLFMTDVPNLFLIFGMHLATCWKPQ